VSQSPINPAPSPTRAIRNKDLAALDPVPALLRRLRAELSADFASGKPIRVSRAPGRLDVMGGIADYTGSLVCELPLDRAAAVALQERDDRQLQVFSFNLFDEHEPFTFRIPLDALADNSIELLHKEFNQPGRKWAGYLAGCVAMLHHRGRINLKNSAIRGMNLALLSTVPLGAGVSSSAAIEVAAMINLIDHFQICDIDPMGLASLCQEVENKIVGAPSGLMDQVSSCAGEEDSLLMMVCQPHELQPPLLLPPGIRVMGINSNVKHNVGGGMYGRTRCAAFMGHRIILEKMREMGREAGATLTSDPMNGYLANLDPDDYKKLFRPFLPERIDGKSFLEQFGPTIDNATRVAPDQGYFVRQAADHHVLEARRVRNFVEHLKTAATLPMDSRQRGLALDKAGHLMYASHLSYTNDALLGAEECDVLVKLVRDREKAGLYGAKITGGGSGGTVAVLCDKGPKADAAIEEIMSEYEKETGRKPQAFLDSSPGAWAVGTAVIQGI
jgi:galactokinase